MKRAPYFVLLAGWLLITTASVALAQIKFTDVTIAKKVPGLLIDGRSRFGHGVAWADISGDGLPDLYVSNAAEGSISYPEVLYISHAGKSYSEEVAARGLADDYGIGSHGLVFFDMDNDGDYDLYNGNTYQEPYGHAYNRLYQNDGHGIFTDVTRKAGLPRADNGTRSVATFDANHDGYLDLFSVGSKTMTYIREAYCFYLNQGDGTFKSVDWGTAAMAEDGFGPNGLTIADYDNDGEQEIFIARVDREQKGLRANDQLLDKQANGLYINIAGSLNVTGGGWSDGATFADHDNDGDLDLFVASSYDKTVRNIYIYRNNGHGTFTSVTGDYNIRQRAFSTVLFDVDNDGDLDLYAMSKDNASEYNHLYANDGRGNFSLAENSGLEVAYFDPRGAGVADMDGDGDLDIYVADTNKIDSPYYNNHLFRNDLSSNNRWLKVTGRGPKGDLGGFGSKIWIFEKNQMDNLNRLVGYKQIISNYGFCCQDDPVQHFGLGQRDSVAVKIVLTDGTTLKIAKVAAKQKISFSKPDHLEMMGGDHQSGKPGELLRQPLQVLVRDVYGNSVAGAPVSFTAKDGRIMETQPVYSDGQGRAQVRYQVGDRVTTQKIQVTMPLVSQSGVEFTATMIPDATDNNPYEVRLISSDSPRGEAGTFLSDSVRVQVLLQDRQPAVGQAVQFKVASGQGSLFPGNSTSLTRNTDRNGIAAVAWKLGTSPGLVIQFLEIQSSWQNNPLLGSPILVTARVDYAITRQLLKMDGDQQTGNPGTLLSKPLIIKLIDSNQQAVPSQSIRFKVTSGGGKVAESDSVTVVTQPNGQARVFWRLGQNLPAEQTVTAFVVDDPNLNVQFTATMLSIVDIRNSQFSADSVVVADGRAVAQLQVQLKDSQNRPLSGMTVQFSASGAENSLVQPVTGTDSQGRVVGYLSSRHAELKYVRAQVVNQSVKFDSISILFIAGAPALLNKLAGDEQTALVRTALAELIVVAVTDSFANPIKGLVIHILAEGPEGYQRIHETISDANGQVYWQWFLGPYSGVYRLSLSAIGIAPITFTARALQRIPHALVAISGMDQKGLAGTLLPIALVVQVVDAGGEPISDMGVRFEVKEGGGVLIPAEFAITDSLGLAQVQWQLGHEASQVVEARVVADEKLTVQFRSMLELPTGISDYRQQPQTFSLEQNYPNPFNESTYIHFGVAQANRIHICVYDCEGKGVRVLVDEFLQPGTYCLVWDGRDVLGVSVPSGIYFYRMESDVFRASRKIIMMK